MTLIFAEKYLSYWRRMMVLLILLVMLSATSSQIYDDSEENDTYPSVTLYEGNSCKIKTGEPGICKRIEQCEIYVKGLRNKNIKYSSIVRCSFIRFTEVICCPLRTVASSLGSRIESTTEKPMPRTSNNERPSQTACRQWKSLDPAALIFHILDGVPVPPGVFAHMGALIQPVQGGGQPDFVVRCGSSLISERFVLTAAHCVAQELLMPTFVRFGVVVWNSKELTPVDIEIENIILHDNYRHPVKYHDIALVKLRKNIEFTQFIRPACLYSDMRDVESAQPLLVLGWGFTDVNTKERSDILLMTNVTTVPLISCNATHINYGVSRNYRIGLDEGQYCAYDPELKKDSCEGDSGGPLQLVENKESTIVGIISFGNSCATTVPSVYARVAFYLDWIERIVWPSS